MSKNNGALETIGAGAGILALVGGGGLFIAFLLLIRPIIFLWAATGLFDLNIQFTFWNMVYAFFLCGTLSSSASCNCKK